MAFKIIRDDNNRYQTGREIVAILDADADLYDLGNAYAPGSTAIVTQQGGNTYMMNASCEWVKLDDGGSANGGGSGLPSGAKPNQYIVTDGDGNAKWEDKLCWSESAKLSWDGDISNPNYDAEKNMCKVSDVPMTKEELVGAKITVRSSDRDGNPIYTTGTIEAGDVSENGGAIVIAKNLTSEIGETCKATAASVLTETMGLAPGVYFSHSNGFYSVTVALDAETIHPIDKKYLPTLTVNIDKDGVADKTIDEIMEAEQGGYSVELMETTDDGVKFKYTRIGNEFVCVNLVDSEELYIYVCEYSWDDEKWQTKGARLNIEVS